MITHNSLSKQQEKVLAAFDKADKDIDLVVLYTRAFDDPGDLSVREIQMRIAPIFTAINKKISGGRIEPGDIKRTYRLTTRG